MISKAKLDFLDSHRRINFKLILKMLIILFLRDIGRKIDLSSFADHRNGEDRRNFLDKAFERDRRYSYSPVSQGITE